MSLLTLDANDKRPPFEQLSSQLLRMISAGELAPGDRLAPIRQLAGDLGIAPNTVARAYRELEQLGAIVSRGRRGTVVAEPTAHADHGVALRVATEELTGAVDAAVAAGMSPLDVIRAVMARVAGARVSPS
ncbi:MAG: GntR family transcriptional regulator [Actinomycetota bacterium]